MAWHSSVMGVAKTIELAGCSIAQVKLATLLNRGRAAAANAAAE